MKALDRKEIRNILIILLVTLILSRLAGCFPVRNEAAVAEVVDEVAVVKPAEPALLGTARRIVVQSQTVEDEPGRNYFVEPELAEQFDMMSLERGDDAFLYKVVRYHKAGILEKAAFRFLKKVNEYDSEEIHLGKTIGIYDYVVAPKAEKEDAETEEPTEEENTESNE